MEFIDDDWDSGSQPRARVVHSRAGASAATNSSASPTSTNRASRSLPHAVACAAAAVLLLAAAYSLDAAYQIPASILVWIACSLLLAPFAPSSVTGGDISVGRGSLLPEQEPSEEPTPDPALTYRRARRQNTAPQPQPPKPSDPVATPVQPHPRKKEATAAAVAVLDRVEKEEEPNEWTDQEMELLRRQMVKHPAGEPQRWEKIASVFGGRRTPESVIRAAKSGATAAASGGSFEQFLRKRKPLDPRSEAAEADAGGNAGGGDGGWSAGDDRALLNALKEFPKDTTMRWEKVAAAVPGKTKAACMKRITELKRDFRSNKASSEAAP